MNKIKKFINKQKMFVRSTKGKWHMIDELNKIRCGSPCKSKTPRYLSTLPSNLCKKCVNALQKKERYDDGGCRPMEIDLMFT